MRIMYLILTLIILLNFSILLVANIEIPKTGKVATVYIPENTTEKEALNSILQAQRDIEEMVKAGFGTAFVNDTLIEAENAFEGVNYTQLLKEVENINDTEERTRATELLLEAQKVLGKTVNYTIVLQKTKIISDRKQQAYDITDSLRALQLEIGEVENLRLDATEIRETYDKALTAFLNERYEDTEKFIEEAHTKLIDIKAETGLINVLYKAGKENIITFIKENWITLLIVLNVTFAAGLVSYSRIMIRRARNKLKTLNIEMEVLTKLMKKVQQDYFIKRTISRETYEIKMKEYTERVLEIKELLPVLNARVGKND